MDTIIKNISIEKIIYKGLGLARSSNGKKILIKGNVLPKSVVDLRITKSKKDFLTAEVIKIHDYDKTWVSSSTPPCGHYLNPLSEKEIGPAYGCGGCKRQVIPYDKQLLLKQQILDDSFRKIAHKISDTDIFPIMQSPQELHYRNKIEYSFGSFDSSQSQCGFHAPWRYDQIIDISHCSLILDDTNEVISLIKKILLEEYSLSCYNTNTHQWLLRHLIVRRGENTNQIMVNIVYSDKYLSSQDDIQRQKALESLSNKPELRAKVATCLITQNNSLSENISNSNNVTMLWGEWYIFEKMTFWQSEGNKWIQATFRISPFSFFQTNTSWAEVLFSEAAKHVTQQQDTILDLYCWTWSIGISLLKQGKGNFLIWIEIIQQAIDDAWENAQINWLQDKVHFVSGKAEKLFRHDEVVRLHLAKITTIIVDPPRDWLHPKVIRFLNQIKKEYNFTLLYISCNPTTLARDIDLLLDGWYSCQTIQPVDMFPQTYHIETIAVLK